MYTCDGLTLSWNFLSIGFHLRLSSQDRSPSSHTRDALVRWTSSLPGEDRQCQELFKMTWLNLSFIKSNQVMNRRKNETFVWSQSDSVKFGIELKKVVLYKSVWKWVPII